MHDGQWLMSDDQSSGVSVYSPWFPRGSDNAMFTFEKIHEFGSPSFTVAVFHKSRETTGDGSVATYAVNWTQVGSTTFWYSRYNGLKEMVRFKFTVIPSSGGTDGVLYRMLAPTWFDKTNA